MNSEEQEAEGAEPPAHFLTTLQGWFSLPIHPPHLSFVMVLPPLPMHLSSVPTALSPLSSSTMAHFLKAVGTFLANLIEPRGGNLDPGCPSYLCPKGL